MFKEHIWKSYKSNWNGDKLGKITELYNSIEGTFIALADSENQLNCSYNIAYRGRGSGSSLNFCPLFQNNKG